MAIVRLSASLTYPQPEEELACEGETVEEVLRACCLQRPGLEKRIFGRGARTTAGVFVNGRSIDQLQGFHTGIGPDDVILLLSPIAGG
jgi:molybdopterin converting factor small subunit